MTGMVLLLQLGPLCQMRRWEMGWGRPEEAVLELSGCADRV